ncbi:outer membrane protein [uncultured Methylobacterium sp.]|uniref:outer membrane protein n=1 Tax=uncultured Methylobacterium sp. TaxID=157278 RepID=UPI0035CB1305
MRLRLFGVILAIGGALAASPSRAADLPVRSAVTPVFVEAGWSGFYFGAQVGAIVDGARGRTVARGDGGLVVPPGFGGRGGRTGNAVGTIAARDLFTGGHLGYNVQSGGLVYGLEGDVDLLGPADDLLGSIRARLGFATPQFLIYGTAGAAFQSVGRRVVGAFVGGNGGNGGNGGPAGDGGAGGNGFGSLLVTRNGADRTGFVGGGGIEVRLSPQVGAGIEALYYVFDGGPAGTGLSRDVLTVRGRLSFHLDPATGPGSIPEPAARWAGGYAGGHLGGLYDLSPRIDRVALANGEAGTPGLRGIDGGGGGGGAVAFAGLQRNTALLGGVHLGYTWQAPGLVYGGEADASFSPEDAYSVLGTVRGRVGVATGGFLFYGTGGLALDRDAGVRGVFAGNGGAGGNGGAIIAAPGGAGGAGGVALAIRAAQTRVGFVAGGGVEARISERVSAGVEALYYDFGDRAVPLLPAPGRSFAPASASDAFVVRTRLSVSFTP